MWDIPTWAGIIIRIVITVIVVLLFRRLLTDEFSTARVNSAVAGAVALGALWLADIEGAGRVAFLGLEIDRRVEAAGLILSRLSDIELSAGRTAKELARIQGEAAETQRQLPEAANRERAIFQIDKLENRAVDGDRSAYLTLLKFPENDSELRERASAASTAVKRYYVGATRTKGVKLSRTLANGEKKEEEDFPTDWLINDLLKNQSWQIRARAAQLLANRRNPGVPEALLTAMETDKHLWVAKESLEAFESVSGFEQIDVFQFLSRSPGQWYEKNKEEVAKKLSVPDAK